MAHFAELDENNTVIRVLAVNNEDINDPINQYSRETEEIGINFLKRLFGENTKWVQTSITNTFRVRYAGIGFKYDENHNVFLLPKPFDSWILDENTYDWISPVPRPDDENDYKWNEELQTWELLIREL